MSSGGFAARDRVYHHVYGHGTISSIDDRYTRIDFDQNGSRKFVTSMMQLEPSEVPAPTRTPSRTRKARTKTKK